MFYGLKYNGIIFGNFIDAGHFNYGQIYLIFTKLMHELKAICGSGDLRIFCTILPFIRTTPSEKYNDNQTKFCVRKCTLRAF